MKAQAATFLRRNLFAVIFACLGLACLGAGAWFWRNLGVLEESLHIHTLQGEAERDTIASSPLLREALTQAHATVTRIERNLVVESNLADNLLYFYTLEQQTQARVRGLNQLTTSGSEDGARTQYKLVPYTLEVGGTYAQVMNFLQSLESGPRLVKIRSFSFRRAAAGSADVILQLDISLLGKS
jgi:Tfp pilus assembly protein PilO